MIRYINYLLLYKANFANVFLETFFCILTYLLFKKFNTIYYTKTYIVNEL